MMAESNCPKASKVQREDDPPREGRRRNGSRGRAVTERRTVTAAHNFSDRPANIVIVGANTEALLASWVFRRHPNFKVRVIGARRPNDQLELPGAHRSALHSAGLARFLRFLDVPYGSFYPRDGMLLRGIIEPFPEVLDRLPADRAREVFDRFTVKETGFELNRPLPRARRDRPRRLRWDAFWLIDTLMKGLDFVVDKVDAITPRVVITGDKVHPYDFLVITNPLIDLRTRLFFSTPPMTAIRRSITVVTAHADRQFSRWDSVLTPFTPGQCACRVQAYGDGYAVETVGAVHERQLAEDLRFFFPTKYAVEFQRADLWTVPIVAPGHELQVPPNVAMLGAEAQCNNSTLDRVFEEAYALLRRWGGRAYAR